MNSRKSTKGRKIVFFFFLYVVFSGVFIYMTSTTIHSQGINRDFVGFAYRQGHEDNNQRMSLKFSGELSNPPLGHGKFVGKLTLDEGVYDLDLKLEPFEAINLYDKNGSSVGTLYTDGLLENITIFINEKVVGAEMILNEETGQLEMTVVEPVNKKEKYGQLIFSGPTQSIDEAIKITEKNISKGY